MPKLVDVAERRDAIAEACWRVIVHEGIAGVTTRKVAAEADVVPGLLFHYFAGKDEIIHASFELLQRRFEEQIDAAMGRADAIDRLRAMALANLPLHESQRLEFGVWLSLWAHSYTSEALRDDERFRYRRWRGLLTDVVRRAIDDGFLRSDLDASVAAAHVAAVTDGLIVQILLEPKRSDVPRLAVAAVDALIDSWTVRERLPVR